MKKLVKENLNEYWEGSEWIDDENEDEGQMDISDIIWKIDKWMPEDSDIQDEYYDILAGGDVDELVEFFDIHANERLDDYLGTQSIRDIAIYAIENKG